MQKIALLLVAGLLAGAAIAASAQPASIWKWRDAQGQMHISDTAPPPEVPARNIVSRPAGLGGPKNTAADADTAPATAAAAPASAASRVDSELQKRKLKADKDKADADAAQKAADEQKNAAARAENCRNAQEQQRILLSGIRVAHVNAAGEREYLDQPAIDAQAKQAANVIAQNCGVKTP